MSVFLTDKTTYYKIRIGDSMKQYHNIDPVYNKYSEILILGSFPSVKSREGMFFYHHPQNRFWKILSHLFEEDVTTIPQKKELLLKYHIALWDVIQSCEIEGSSDTSIKHVVVNDIEKLIKDSQITTIYTNGKKAHQLYQRYVYPITNIDDICLPSTSPANAAYSLENLLSIWKQIKRC